MVSKTWPELATPEASELKEIVERITGLLAKKIKTHGADYFPTKIFIFRQKHLFFVGVLPGYETTISDKSTHLY